MSLKILSRQAGKVLSFLRSGIAKGRLNKQIYQALRDESPWSYRKQTVLDDLNILRGVEIGWEGLRAIGKNRVPSLRHYQTTRKVLPARYSTKIYVSGINKVTGEQVERYVTVRHEELHKIKDLEAKAQRALEEAKSPISVDKMYAIEAYASI